MSFPAIPGHTVLAVRAIFPVPPPAPGWTGTITVRGTPATRTHHDVLALNQAAFSFLPATRPAPSVQALILQNHGIITHGYVPFAAASNCEEFTKLPGPC